MPSASSTEGEDEDTTQRLHFPVEAINIVLNVHHYNKDIAKEEFPIKKTSIMTNLPYSTVWKIVKRGIKHRKLRCDSGVARKLNTEQHAHSVRYAIYEMLEKKIAPTLKSLKDKLISEQRIGFEFSVETLRKFLQVIGFHYKTIDRRQVVMESPRIKKWRYDYLVEIQKCREENKTIHFLDETWYDSHDVVKKGWVNGSKMRFGCQTRKRKTHYYIACWF
jgi:transposase